MATSGRSAGERAWAVVRTVVPRGVRNFARDPGPGVRAMWQSARAAAGGADRVAVRPGWTVTCHPVSTVAFQAQTSDEDCRAELDGFIARCRPGMCLLDVGSHYGVFTVAALHYGGPGSSVVAVDPSVAAGPVLTANVRHAGGAGRVTVIQAAAGAADGELAMLTTGAGGGNFMVAADAPRPDTERVPQFTLAALAARAPAAVTHLKIDVEGFEDEAVRGGQDYLAAVRPTVFLELHGDALRLRRRDPAGVLDRLRAAGYTRFESRGRECSPAALAAAPLARIVCTAGPA